MVIYPYSPPVFPQTYSSPPYNNSQDSSSRKRKRQYETEEDLPTHVFIENEHISKKQRDEVVAPLTPTSPPSSIISVQRFLSPSSSEHHPLLHNGSNVRIVIGDSNNTKISITNPSFTIQHPSTSQSSDVVDTPIPSQNLLLRNLHMQSRTYQFNQGHLHSIDKDEEMWEEEEESVAERYSAMNKLLGSRKPVW